VDENNELYDKELCNIDSKLPSNRGSFRNIIVINTNVHDAIF